MFCHMDTVFIKDLVLLLAEQDANSSLLIARIIHEGSAASTDTRLRQAVSPFSPSTYCTSMPQDFTAPGARLASRLHAFATNLHE
jgi:hypothetical protein